MDLRRLHATASPAETAGRGPDPVALAPVEPLIKAGTIRALAVTGVQRWFSLPDVSTVIESGDPGSVSDTFNALFAPAGTPKDILARLHKAAQTAVARPEAREAARRAGFAIVAGTPEQLAARLVAVTAGVKQSVARTGTKVE
jgi:tripartite-type tricarboxylate transporter receptor subunit TctC